MEWQNLRPEILAGSSGGADSNGYARIGTTVLVGGKSGMGISRNKFGIWSMWEVGEAESMKLYNV